MISLLKSSVTQGSKRGLDTMCLMVSILLVLGIFPINYLGRKFVVENKILLMV